jgi:hypothetical protein
MFSTLPMMESGDGEMVADVGTHTVHFWPTSRRLRRARFPLTSRSLTDLTNMHSSTHLSTTYAMLQPPPLARRRLLRP